MINKTIKNNNYKNIVNNYIAGLVHADGTFTAPLIRNKKIYISPRFILKQHKDNKEILNLIKLKFNNIGNIKYENNIGIYTISNINEINNILIPIFDKNQVRGNRYYSYLKFKLLLKILINEKIKYKSSLWLFCIILTTLINPNVKLSKQIRYLNIEEQYYINNKIFPKEIDINIYINKYCPELLNYNLFDKNVNIKNTQKLNKEFINGLIDGDGSLEVSLIKNNNIFKNKIKFQIIQDIYNKNILEEIKLFFDNKGYIIKNNNENSISYFIYSKKELRNNLIPKLLNINNIYEENINFNTLTGPKIKLYKLYNYILIEKLLKFNKLNNPIILDKIIEYIYNIIKNPKNLTLIEFKKYIKK